MASNCSSSYLTRDTIPFYMQGRYPWAWLSPALFGDGAGALVLRSSTKRGDRGLVHTWYETQPDLAIILIIAWAPLRLTPSRKTSSN